MGLLCWLSGHRELHPDGFMGEVFGEEDFATIDTPTSNITFVVKLCARCKLLYWEARC